MSYPVNSDYGNRSQFFSKAVPLGVATTGAGIAYYALNKANRADTYVNTAKNCAKEFTKDGRKTVQELLKKVKWDSAAEYVGKLSNKKMFAGVAGAAVLVSATIFNTIGKIFNNR